MFGFKTFGFATPVIKAVAETGAGVAPAEPIYAARIVPEQEKEQLYHELGFKPTATVYEVLRMERPAHEMSAAELGQYAAKLNAHADELLKKYDPDNFDNKVNDIMKEIELGIPRFSRKIYELVLAAKQEIARDVKARA